MNAPTATSPRTARQQEVEAACTIVFAYICWYKSGNDGNPPTIRKIQRVCRVSSTSVVSCYLKRLERDGFLDLTNGIQVVGGEWKYNGKGNSDEV